MVTRRRRGVRAGERSGARFRQLARFRYQLRKFLRFSEWAARRAGVTPQQHQLMLGVAGFNGKGWATISELAEFLQERHNAVVGLVERARRAGLVTKQTAARDRRVVRVELTPKGGRVLARLSALHYSEIHRFRKQALGDRFPSSGLQQNTGKSGAERSYDGSN